MGGKIGIKLLKNELENLLKRGQLQQLLERLCEVKRQKDEVLLLTSRYSHLQRENKRDIIDHEYYQRVRNQITESALEEISTINTEEDLESGWTLMGANRRPILVYAFTDETRNKLRDLFSHYYYPSVTFAEGDALLSLPVPVVEGEEPPLVVFCMDHVKRDIKSKHYESDPDILTNSHRDQFNLLSRIVIEGKWFVVFYGNYYYKLEEWRDLVHGANSVISLLPRVDEMLVFLEKTGR